MTLCLCVASVDTVLSDIGYEPKINMKDVDKLKREIKDMLKSEVMDKKREKDNGQ